MTGTRTAPPEGEGAETQIPPNGNDVVVPPPSSGNDTAPIEPTPTCTPEASIGRPSWLQKWDGFVNDMQELLNGKYGEGGVIFNRIESDPNAIKEPQSEDQAEAMMTVGEKAVKAMIKHTPDPNACGCNYLVQAYYDIPIEILNDEITGTSRPDVPNISEYTNPDSNYFRFTKQDDFSLETSVVVYTSLEGEISAHSAIVAWHNSEDSLGSIILQTNAPASVYGLYYTTIRGNQFSTIYGDNTVFQYLKEVYLQTN